LSILYQSLRENSVVERKHMGDHPRRRQGLPKGKKQGTRKRSRKEKHAQPKGAFLTYGKEKRKLTPHVLEGRILQGEREKIIHPFQKRNLNEPRKQPFSKPIRGERKGDLLERRLRKVTIHAQKKSISNTARSLEKGGKEEGVLLGSREEERGTTVDGWSEGG